MPKKHSYNGYGGGFPPGAMTLPGDNTRLPVYRVREAGIFILGDLV